MRKKLCTYLPTPPLPGFLYTFTKVVSQHALRDVVAEHFAGTKHTPLNLKVLGEGFNLV